MRKKLLIIFSILLIFSSVNFFMPVSADTIPVTVIPSDISGETKAYFNSPYSVAAAIIDGKEVVFIGDRNPSNILVYTENNIYEIDYIITNPYKLEIYSHFLFVYDRNKIIIFDISSPSSPEYVQDFISEKNIDDFSISGNTMFILYRDFFVQKYTLADDVIISIQEGGEYDFTLYYPENITAVDSDNFILKKDDTYLKGDLSGQTTEIKSGADGNFTRYYDGKLYYYYSNNIYSLDIISKEIKNFSISNISHPQSGEITTVSNIYVCGSGLYVVDSIQKKIVCLNASDFSYISCLSSFSYDLGRYKNPQNISVNGNNILVCDTDNDRVQIICGDIIISINIEAPKFAVQSGSGVIYAVSDNKIYTGENLLAVFNLPAGLLEIRDVKISSDGRLYVLSDTALYAADDSGVLNLVLSISGGLKFSLNIKTQDIYILSAGSITIYDKNYITKNTLTVASGGYNTLETDFAGNIYILAENYNGGSPAIIKYEYSDYGEITEYILSGIKLTDVCAAIDHTAGNFYIASADAQAVYKILKSDMNVAIAIDIPTITLPKNPLDSGSSYDTQVVTIGGYPSTIFYPFDITLKNEAYYPGEMAYEGEILYIESGAKVLSVYSAGNYNLIIYQGKFGFILNDNITVSANKNVPYENGELLLSANIYKIPYLTLIDGHSAFLVINNEDNEGTLKKSLPQKNGVKLLYELSGYDGSGLDWYYIEFTVDNIPYNGYVNKTLIAAVTIGEDHYITGKLYSENGRINVYEYGYQNIINTIGSGDLVKIYSYNGDYAYIEFIDTQGIINSGYILKSDIAEDNTFEKQKLGFILALSTFTAAIIFIIIKRKFFYN